MKLQIRVAGILCQAHVLSYSPATPGQYSGPPEHCYPAEPAELEWELLDRRGRPAPWLERKLSAVAREQLTAELLEQIESEARDTPAYDALDNLLSEIEYEEVESSYAP